MSLSYNHSKLRRTGTAPEKSEAGGSACVEISSFPQILYVRSFGDPDTLFVPLLDATRDALELIERVSNHGEKPESAVMLSGMHLASSLLSDPSFSLGARGLSPENSYKINLDAGTLHLSAQLYSVVSRRTSLFKVEIAGKISEGVYVVRNPIQGNVIMQVDEERLRQPLFFASSLAQECVRWQIDQERFGRIGETSGPEASEDVSMMVTVDGNKFPIVLQKKKEGDGWNIVDKRRQELVGALSPDMEKHLGAVMNFIQELLTSK